MHARRRGFQPRLRGPRRVPGAGQENGGSQAVGAGADYSGEVLMTGGNPWLL